MSFDTFVNRNISKLSLECFQISFVPDDYQLYQVDVTRNMAKDSDKVCHCINLDLDKLLFQTKLTRQKQCYLYDRSHYYPINVEHRLNHRKRTDGTRDRLVAMRKEAAR